MALIGFGNRPGRRSHLEFLRRRQPTIRQFEGVPDGVASSPAIDTRRPANANDCSWKNGSFIMYNAWLGVVVSVRWAVLAIGSAPSNSARRDPFEYACVHQVHAAEFTWVVGLEGSVDREPPRWHGRKRMDAARGRIKLPTDGENRVANAFGIEPMAIHSPKQIILRIDRQAIVAIRGSTSGRSAKGPSACASS